MKNDEARKKLHKNNLQVQKLNDIMVANDDLKDKLNLNDKDYEADKKNQGRYIRR